MIVTTIGDAAREHGELLRRHLGTVVTADDIFTTLNDAAAYRDGSFVYVPARRRARASRSRSPAVQARTGTLLNQRTLIVLEEGAQAEVWEQYLSGSDDVDGRLQRRHRAGRRRQRAPPLRLRSGAVRAQLDLRRPARRGRPRRVARLGRARVRLRPRPRADGDAAGRRGGRRPRHRRLRDPCPPAHRLRHHPGARGAEHDLGPRFPRRAAGPLERRLEGQHHRRPRARRRPTRSRSRATC